VEKKLQVFVSSTYLDLINERQKAVEGILRSKHIPAGMELFIPSDKTQWEIIKEWIRDSDLLILILGGRYGSIEPESGKSYTQLEYEFAISNKIPVFAIVLNEQFLANKKSKKIELKVYEHEAENPALENYKAFKQIVMSNLVSIVEDINQISTEVSLALQEFIRKDDKEYNFRGWVRGKERSNPLEMTVEYNIKKFLDDKNRQGLAEGTMGNYSASLRIFQNYFTGIEITEIDKGKIKDFLKYREDNFSITSKNTMESYRGFLNVFFDWLVQENIVEVNPVKQVKPYKIQKRGNVALNNEQIKQLRDACNTHRERAMVEVFLSTGCHLAELKEIRLENIDWANSTISFFSGDKERIVILNDTAKEYLNKYLDTRNDNLSNLFVTERKPYRQLSNRGIQREIDVIASRTNISRNISPRTFRDTFARVMLEQGIQSNILQLLLGYHSKVSRSETYFILTKSNIRDMINSLPNM
jgi:site-specific recombinase XerD